MASSPPPLDVLVGRAGRAVAIAALDLLGGAYGRRVVVVAGRGNNGADGRTAATILRRRGARVRVIDAGSGEQIGPADLAIDAAYGTGFHGQYEAPSLPAGTPVLAVDIPSGVAGDTGAACGSPWAALRTVTFVALKPGLVQGDGAELGRRSAGGRHRAARRDRRPSSIMEDADVGRLFPARAGAGNKWSAAVLVVAGSPGMTGAASFVTTAAYRSGAGMVRLGVPGAPLSELPASEAVSVELPATGWATSALEVAERCAAVVVGPGLGRAKGIDSEVGRLLAESPAPVVVDADGLFALGRLDGGKLAKCRSPVVLTPHDGEYARLVGEPPGPDRIAAARRLAHAERCHRSAQGTDHGGGRPRWSGPARAHGDASVGHGRHRRRPLGDDRGDGGPGYVAARGGRTGRPRARSGRRARARRGSGGRRPA